MRLPPAYLVLKTAFLAKVFAQEFDGENNNNNENDSQQPWSQWKLAEPDPKLNSCETVWDEECLMKCRSHQGTCTEASLSEIANGHDIRAENCQEKCRKTRKIHSNKTEELYDTYRQIEITELDDMDQIAVVFYTASRMEDELTDNNVITDERGEPILMYLGAAMMKEMQLDSEKEGDMPVTAMKKTFSLIPVLSNTFLRRRFCMQDMVKAQVWHGFSNFNGKKRRKRENRLKVSSLHAMLEESFTSTFRFLMPAWCDDCYSKEKAAFRNNGVPGTTPQGGERYLISKHGETRSCGGRSCSCFDGTLTCGETCSHRKEYNMLGTDLKGYNEKQMLVDALHWVHDSCKTGSGVDCGNFIGTSNPWTFDTHRWWHYEANSHAHGNSRFLPWHRMYLKELETRFQMFHECVTLPYWDWTLDADDENNAHVYDNFYFGNRDGSQTANPTYDPSATSHLGQFMSNDPTHAHYYSLSAEYYDPSKTNSWDFTSNYHSWNRNGGSTTDGTHGGFTDDAGVATLMNLGSYSSLNTQIEGGSGHVAPHVRVSGHMGHIYFSSSDPFFWMHHAMADKIWYDWQRRSGNAFSFSGNTATYLSAYGHWGNTPVSEVMDSRNSDTIMVCYRNPLVIWDHDIIHHKKFEHMLTFAGRKKRQTDDYSDKMNYDEESGVSKIDIISNLDPSYFNDIRRGGPMGNGKQPECPEDIILSEDYIKWITSSGISVERVKQDMFKTWGRISDSAIPDDYKNICSEFQTKKEKTACLIKSQLVDHCPGNVPENMSPSTFPPPVEPTQVPQYDSDGTCISCECLPCESGCVLHSSPRQSAECMCPSGKTLAEDGFKCIVISDNTAPCNDMTITGSVIASDQSLRPWGESEKCLNKRYSGYKNDQDVWIWKCDVQNQNQNKAGKYKWSYDTNTRQIVSVGSTENDPNNPFCLYIKGDLSRKANQRVYITECKANDERQLFVIEAGRLHSVANPMLCLNNAGADQEQYANMDGYPLFIGYCVPTSFLASY